MNLEQTSEKEMIPLIFLDMPLNCKARYKRLDNEEVLEGRVEILRQNRLSVLVDYSGEGTIKMRPTLKEADALLFPCIPDEKIKRYICHYCKIYPDEKKIRLIGGFFIPK